MNNKHWRVPVGASLAVHLVLFCLALQLGSSPSIAEPKPIEVDLGFQPEVALQADCAAKTTRPRAERLPDPRPAAPLRDAAPGAAPAAILPGVPLREPAGQDQAPPSPAAALREPPARERSGGSLVPLAFASAPLAVSGRGAGAALPAPTPLSAGGNAPAAAAASAAPGQLPCLIKWSPPPYPREASSKGWVGKVRVRVLISELGTVRDAMIAISSGHASLDDAARECSRHWLFTPAYQKGRAVAAWVVVPVLFTLD